MESSPQSQENLAARLKNKRICRFCMSQREPLTNIYSKENRVNSSAPLPLQIMSCVSIEVFTNDGMPATICEMCRRLMEYCYRFKQMCKKADTSLRQFPLTSKWPDALEIPKLPDALRQASEPQKHVILNSIPVVKIEDQEEPPIIERTVKPEVGDRRPNPQTTLRPQMRTPTKPKILNKSSMKILNKSANVNTEPILSSPIITQNESGQMEIVTEIIEVPRIEEPDPVLTAEPVETNVFPCPHCERSFPLRQLLDIHMVNHNRERSFACELCDKRFFSKYDLGKHMLIHTGEKPYKCVVCNKSFTRSTLLHRHEKVHIDQPKFLCVFCEKPFLSKDELDKHTERHQKSRPFPCKICGKSFAFKQGLERHETIHARQQPFPCQYCEQSFSTPSKLSRHLTAHAGDRPFPCKLCPKSYLLSHHLTRHMRSHTQGSGSFKCYDCERSFATRDDLIYHSAVHATQNLMCPLCKEQFENLEQVTEHIKQHSEGEQYACEFCDLIFLTEEKLQSHCETKHVDDMAAYDQHDKRNEKGGAGSNYNSAEESQEEVLQEFIIEEYDGTADNIKQEGETHIEDAVVIQSSSAPAKKVKILNKEASSVRRPNILRSLQNRKVSSEPAAETMEIEELEKYENKDDEEQEEMLTDDDETYEPPPKITRFIKSVAQPAKSAPPKPVQQQQKSVFKVPVKKEARLTQPTISAVLQQLPKTVTIVKKEKQPSPENKIAPASQVRVLNEKIIKKADDSPTLTKSVRLTDVKTPVRVIEKKSTSPNENIPVKNKASPIAGPSNTTPEVKAAQKQSPTTASKSPQSAGKKNLVEMMIDNRKVKVQKIVMTKAEVAAMAKEGKIEMKGGTMILKQNGKSLSGKIVSKQTTPSK